MPHEPTPTGEIILDQTEDGRTRVECRFANENPWLSQTLIADLFQLTEAPEEKISHEVSQL